MNELPKRKNIRLKNYDYSSNGFYFVTICTFHKEPNIQKYHKVVEKTIIPLGNRFPGLSIDYFVLMPTHLHVIFVFNEVKTKLSEIVRVIKALISKETRKKNFWQRNYYEHVIRNEETLLRIREYIQDNPLVEKIDFKQFYYNKMGLINQTPTNKSRGLIY